MLVTALWLPCRERAEKRRLQRQLNKERRGAMRELRKDAVFISEERDREKSQAAAERAQVGLACCGWHQAVRLSGVTWVQDCCICWAAAPLNVVSAGAGCRCRAARGAGASLPLKSAAEVCSLTRSLPSSMQPAKIVLRGLQAYRKAVSFLEQQEADFKSGGQGGMWKGKKGKR